MNEEYLEAKMSPPNTKPESDKKQDDDSELERDDENKEEGKSKSSDDDKSYKIGAYYILKTLGEGTFGKVKLGKHILTD